MSPFSVFTFSPPEPQAKLPEDPFSAGPFGPTMRAPASKAVEVI